jgi:hypothetical protein
LEPGQGNFAVYSPGSYGLRRCLVGFRFLPLELGPAMYFSIWLIVAVGDLRVPLRRYFVRVIVLVLALEVLHSLVVSPLDL